MAKAQKGNSPLRVVDGQIPRVSPAPRHIRWVACTSGSKELIILNILVLKEGQNLNQLHIIH